MVMSRRRGVEAAAAIPARITQAIDEARMVQMKGNVHPLARAEFDQGAASSATPMKRMPLLLQRSPEQEAALKALSRLVLLQMEFRRNLILLKEALSDRTREEHERERELKKVQDQLLRVLRLNP